MTMASPAARSVMQTHVIDEESPLYGLSKSDFAEFGLEVMVLLVS